MTGGSYKEMNSTLFYFKRAGVPNDTTAGQQPQGIDALPIAHLL
jgi:hypothetical protein